MRRRPMSIPVEAIFYILYSVTSCREFQIDPLMDFLEKARNSGILLPRPREIVMVLPFMVHAGLLDYDSNRRILIIKDVNVLARIGKALVDPIIKLLDKSTVNNYSKFEEYVMTEKENIKQWCR